MSLSDLRREIDAIDGDIVKLLDARAKAAAAIADEKKRLGKPMHDPGRERAVLDAVGARAGGSLSPDAVRAIYRTIMSETLAMEKQLIDMRSPCGGPPAGKRDAAATVVENNPAAPGFFRMRLVVPEFAEAFAPGQFFQLLIAPAGAELFLRRPFAPAEMTDDGFAFLYAVVGRGTRAMTALRAGDAVRVLAPLGNGYTVPQGSARAVLVGGGCGGPSLGPLARQLRAQGVETRVVLGAKSSCSLLNRDYFLENADRVVVATDDGSEGLAGTSVLALEELLDASPQAPDAIYACGPHPMLGAVAKVAARREIFCQVSLEERMACGFGACMGCVVQTLDPAAPAGVKYRRVCHDGPVFDAQVIDWR